MKIRKDIFNNIPKIGDIIVFNPPKYSGLTKGVCIGFTEAGSPKLNELDSLAGIWELDYKRKGYYSVKSKDFVIK